MKMVHILFFNAIFASSIVTASQQISYYDQATIEVKTSFWLDMKNYTKISTIGDWLNHYCAGRAQERIDRVLTNDSTEPPIAPPSIQMLISACMQEGNFTLEHQNNILNFTFEDGSVLTFNREC